MNRLRVLMALGLLIVPLAAGKARAQQVVPHLGYVFPAGGQQGTTVEVTVGGRLLDRIKRVTFSGEGLEAKVLRMIEPIKSEEAGKLRKRITELNKTPRDKRDEKTRMEIAGLERKLAVYMGETTTRRTYPAISQAVALQIAIAADAPPGRRELRIETDRGLSAPIRFFVGRLPEFREDPPALSPESPDYPAPLRFPPLVTTDITLPAVANGQVVPRVPDYVHWQAKRFTPGEVDRYRFTARKSQRLVVAAAARELVPYLADAVPGWFQATLSIYDASGREVAFADDNRNHPDPVLYFEVPEDGQYVVEIKDSIYRGRPDFVYRITIGELPHITGIFPLGGPAGAATEVELTGHNLPADKLTVDTKGKSPGTIPVVVGGKDARSNALPFAVGTLPECLEKEPNDSAKAAQPVTLPMIVNGRIDRPGDRDVFRIEGRAGQQIVAEVDARRLHSPLDSVLELTDAQGKRVAFNDDHVDKADALNTHHADSLINATLPSDGVYFVRLGDAQRQGGREFAYRLRISRPRPDFELRVVPSAINAESWRLKPITVYARKDGFDGEIALSFEGDPAGIIMDGARIPAGAEKVRVTLAMARWLGFEPIKLRLQGKAPVGRQEVVRRAVAADDVMQAFIYWHLVPAGELTLLMPGKGDPPKPPDDPRSFESMWRLLDESPIRIPVGGKVEFKARAPWDATRGEIQVVLNDPPEGIAIEKATCADRIVTVVLRANADKAKPGLRGNLIADGYQQRTSTDKDGKTREYRSFLGPLPAIPLEVVEP